jgi:hypothetical protein
VSQITEQRSSTGPTPGEFTIDLLHNTPSSVREHVARHPLSYIVVTPVHLTDPGLGAGTLFGNAIYVGQIRSLDRDITTLQGEDMCVLLGDSDGLGDIYQGADTTGASAAFQTHFADNITGRMNGLGTGTIGTSSAFTLPKETGDTRREWLDFMCAAVPGTDFEWVISPLTGVNANTAANLFPTGQVIFTPDAGGRDGNIVGSRAEITLGEQDWSDLTSQTVVDYDQNPANFKTATNTITNMVTPGGAAYSAERLISNRMTARPTRGGWAALRRWLIRNATNAQKVANRERTRFSTARQQLDVTVFEFAPRRLGIYPGVTVYLHDPTIGLSNTANQVQYRGETVFPVTSRIMKMIWPVADGMGVYHWHSNGAGGMTFTDLTRWVDFNPNPAVSLEVGALRRTFTRN